MMKKTRTTTTEVWKDIPGYVGAYQCSNHSRVKSLARKDARGRRQPERILKPYKHTAGYLQVTLCNSEGKKTKFLLHRLVAQAFIKGKSKDRNCVNHRNGNRSDNRLENLEWVSHSENHLHAFRKLGRKPSFAKGENSPHAKLTVYEIQEIKAALDSGLFSGCKIAKAYGVSSTQVYRIRDNKTWQSVI